MQLVEAASWIGEMIDGFASSDAALLVGVASQDPEDAGVPPEMQVGPVDPEGWVEWGVRPSAVEARDLDALEADLGCALPTQLKAYLTSRAHLFEQVHSKRYGQLIMLPPLPTREPLRAFRALLTGWLPLVRAGYLPFGEWGDGWGPMCIDLGGVNADDGPVVWFDHERLISLGEDTCARRDIVAPHSIELYPSFVACLQDVFGVTPLAER
ncbi:MAG: SMI1/KNR4 family protein [Myxococcota bacterium]|nr:SMI1/KNR4 family protein [Myxococcota bacterium]